ncbi:MAG: hypothetical protein N2318_13105 [Meiothermus sp.]|nr:hypothetical protein [Meiothermus sp.]
MDTCKVLGFAVWLLGQGPVVSFLVDALKRMAWVRQNPRRAVVILNALAALSTGLTLCGLGLENLLLQMAAGIAGSVATYEFITKPLAARLAPPERPEPLE